MVVADNREVAVQPRSPASRIWSDEISIKNHSSPVLMALGQKERFAAMAKTVDF
jgi:hypothetical protein